MSGSRSRWREIFRLWRASTDQHRQLREVERDRDAALELDVASVNRFPPL